MASEALEAVHTRNEFYRDNYRRLMLVLLVVIGIMAVMASTFIYLILNPPAPKYIAMDEQHRIIPLVPLSRPNLTNTALLQWANTAAIASYSYSFVNYRQELQAASAFFTADGWRAFLATLKSSGNLDAVIAKKLNVSAVATGTPIIQDERIINGSYTWTVQIPMLVTYQSPNQTSAPRVTVTMTIVRVSPLSSARGIGISSFIESGEG